MPRSLSTRGYAVESVKEVENNSPKQLVVVVDGSETLKVMPKT